MRLLVLRMVHQLGQPANLRRAVDVVSAGKPG